MKKLALISLPFLLLTFCSDNSNVLSPTEEIKYKSIAYASLTDQEKESLTKDWKEARVNVGRYQHNIQIHTVVINSNDKMSFELTDSSITLIENQKLVTIMFNTNNDPLVGPIIVVIEPEIDRAIGQVLRL